MERYLVNKVINGCLTTEFRIESWIVTNRYFIANDNRMPAKVEIDKLSFTIRDIDAPSISTTNSQLLQTVLDHIDDVIQ